MYWLTWKRGFQPFQRFSDQCGVLYTLTYNLSTVVMLDYIFNAENHSYLSQPLFKLNFFLQSISHNLGILAPATIFFLHYPLVSFASPLLVSSIRLVNYNILLKGWQHEILYYSLSFTVCVQNGYHRKILAFSCVSEPYIIHFRW